MPQTVAIKPELIQWAINRSRIAFDELRTKFPKIDAWLAGEGQPTFKQLEDFAKRTHTPYGYLFLSAPPDEPLPFPDFRTKGDVAIDRPSPDLIETIYAMQRRQDWMREFVIEEGQESLQFVGSARNTQNLVSLAAHIRETLGLNADWAELHATWEAALTTLRNSAERIGILVASSSVVGLNTHRTLDPQEFRGFVLVDDYAPLVFVNSADSKSARMFTLAHELAHVWVGQGGLFNLIRTIPRDDATERFCNRVAAEFLVPQHKLHEHWKEVRSGARPFHTIAKLFKVSPVVAARRAWDLKLITREQFFGFYEQDQQEWAKHKAEQRLREARGGPNFYDVQDSRLGKRFAYAVVRAAREGRLLFREAYELTDLRGDTFNRYADRLTQKVIDERR